MGTLFFQAEGRIRTDGLLITNELLCQLSYFGNSEIDKANFGSFVLVSGS